MIIMNLCACGSSTSTATSSYEENSGYFEDIISDVYDSFGEKKGETHTVVAAAKAYSKEKNTME